MHLISDAATMQIIRWTKGGFGMAAHNYDGDMLTDEIAQVHRSPGFITSNLIGKREDGVLIKEFEASHGTVADLWQMHLDGKETSMNPLGMIEALMGAMNHSARLLQESCGDKDPTAKKTAEDLLLFTSDLRKALHNTFRYGQGTRDMSGAEGLTTERFVDKVAWRLGRYVASHYDDVEQPRVITPARSNRRNYNIDTVKLKALFDECDIDRDGSINLKELEAMLVKLGVAPLVDPLKRGSASSDRVSASELSAAALTETTAK